MFKLSEDLSNVEVKWIDTILDVHHGGSVLIDGKIFGSNWINNAQGNWCCIDWETGEKYYEEKSREVQSEKQKNIFLKLAKEEVKHFFIIDNLLIHVSRPQSWVEDAEFNPREEY